METLIGQLVAEFTTLSLTDGATICTLAVLEGLLSVDNALVLAILVRGLPESQRKKALLYGIIGAFFFRFVALLFAAYLMNFMFFKLIGGGYLVYLAMKHMFFFYKEDAHQASPKVAASFWKTVLMVELTDIAFSIDSITTAVAMTNKLLIVWSGGILGIIMLRFAAGFFVRVLEKLPRLEDLAYQLIFFIGIKLTLESFHVEIQHWVFWLIMGLIAVIGASLVYRDYHQRKTKTQYHNRQLEQFKQGTISINELLSMEYIPREIIDYLRNKQDILIRAPTIE